MNNNNFNGIVGDHLMIAHYVRYDRLAELINAEFHNSNYNEINLCIDAYSMIKSIYKLQPNQFIDELSIASCIINACAHYRNFFWTRYNVTCKIYVVFSRMEQSIAEAKMFYPNYENIFTTERNPSMDVLIDRNMGVLEELCPYIHDVKFIHTRYEPGLVFGNVAESNKLIPTIIVSKDPWVLQVVSAYKNVYVLRPIKSNGMDLSALINNSDLMAYYMEMRKTKVSFYDSMFIPSERLPYIIASTNFPERKLPRLHLLPTISKLVTEANYNPHLVGVPVIDVKYFTEELCKSYNVNLKTFEIECRHNAIGYQPCFIRYIISPMVDNLDMINLHNPDQIKLINERYFSKVPLDLMSL